MRIFELKKPNYKIYLDLDRVISVIVSEDSAYCSLVAPILDSYGCQKTGHTIPKDQIEEFLKAWKNELPNDGPYR